jgi:chromosomal replication initiator protein
MSGPAPLFEPDLSSQTTVLTRDLWEQVRELFQQRFGSSVAQLWFRSMRLLSFRRGVVTIGVANEMVREYLDRRYGASFAEFFTSLTGSSVTVHFQLDDYLHRAMPQATGETAVPAQGEPAPPMAEEGPGDQHQFVVRPENRTCYAALKRSLLEAAPLFNPIFIHGPAGCGKTALMRWYLDTLARERGSVSCFSATGEEFTRRFTRGIRGGTAAAFRGDIVANELLVLDEVHRLADRLATQAELLSILKYFLERQRQVILLSRHSPRDILHLDSSLRSYFLSGLVLGMTDLSVPSRVTVLEQHVALFRRRIPTAVIESIVGRVSGGLKGELSLVRRVAALAALRDADVTPAFVRDNFPELGDRPLPDDLLQRLIDSVCEAMQVAKDDLLRGRKTRRTAIARHVTIYLAANVFGFSSRRIGRSLGTLSPSVVPYAKRRVEELRREDRGVDDLIRRLRDELGTGQKFLF